MRHSIWSCANRLIDSWRRWCQPFFDAKHFSLSCPCGFPRTCPSLIPLIFSRCDLLVSSWTWRACCSAKQVYGDRVSSRINISSACETSNCPAIRLRHLPIRDTTISCSCTSDLVDMREDPRSNMEREASISSDPTSMRRHHRPVLPPWEVRSVAQVPFIEPGSPPLVRRDDQGFFAVGPTPRANHRPKLSATISAPCGSEYSSPVTDHSNSYPWKAAPPGHSSQLPIEPPYETLVSKGPTYDSPAYESPHSSKPIFRKAASQPPPSCVLQAPPTPPDSVSRASVRSTSASPPLRPASKALPGTMSSRASRNRSASHHGTKSGPRENRIDHHQAKQDQIGLGKRFKSAFRDIFKKDPVDDSQFERISDRHWTDEY